MSDCWRRCVAHLIGDQPDLVPDFVKADPMNWLGDTAEWLTWRGYQLIALVGVNTGLIVDVLPHVIANGQHIRAGELASGEIHAVVMEADGSVWDPMPELGPITGVCGMYWVVRG